MQIAAFASILALAASASATTIYGTLQMYFDANATCGADLVIFPEGKSLAVGTLDDCSPILPTTSGVEYQRFMSRPRSPGIHFQLYSDAECKELVTEEPRVCVEGIKSYRVVQQ